MRRLLPLRLGLFLSFWTLLNLVQAAFTELNPDEAYYALYAQHLDWGYFDHPPVIALMIRAGTTLLGGELGVRLFTVLLSTSLLFLLWILAGKPRQGERLKLFLLLCGAMPFFHVYGFVATPDSPLLFFAALFYVIFRRLGQNEGKKPGKDGFRWIWWLAWGACMAAMMYSKYHGILVIAFAVLAWPRMLRLPAFYLSAGFGVLLFLPHLFWQYDQGFPSLRYHLIARNNPFQPKHLIAYLSNQLLIFSPFLFPFLLQALVRGLRRFRTTGSTMRRVYLLTVVGFWVFFLVTVVRGHVEPQWTAVLSIPLLLLAFSHARGKDNYTLWLRRMAVLSFAILMLVRILLLKGVFEESLPLFHERGWIQELQTETGAFPVLFNNAYREPSMYRFYAEAPAYTTYTLDARRANQFNLWDWEGDMQGKRVALVQDTSMWDCDDCRLLNAADREFYLKWLDAYPVVPDLSLTDGPTGSTWRQGEVIPFRIELKNTGDRAAQLEQGDMPLRLVAVFHRRPDSSPADGRQASPAYSLRSKAGSWFYIPVDLGPVSLAAGEEASYSLSFRVPEDWAGSGSFGLSLQLGNLQPFMPRSLQEVEVLTPSK